MHLLGCFLGLFLAVFLIALNLGVRAVWFVRNLLKGMGLDGSGNTSSRSYQSQQSTHHQSQQSSTEQKGQTRSKVFEDSEGEYVDFEEVKD